jgi:hypothetical protein
MVIALPSTGPDGPALALTSDEVWGEDKLIHLSGLPVTNTGDNPLSPVRGMVGSECLSGLYPVPIRDAIQRTPLVWCMNGDVVFSVGSATHKARWTIKSRAGSALASQRKQVIEKYVSPHSVKKRWTRACSTSYPWLCLYLFQPRPAHRLRHERQDNGRKMI